MSMPLLRPRVSELTFLLYPRPLHPELFETLATRQVRREDYTLTLWVTRTGHVITWRNRRICLTEVTGCDTDLPGWGQLLRQRLRGERSDRVGSLPGVGYQSSFQVEVLPPEVFRHVHGEILADGGARGLLHAFEANHRLSLTPVGAIILDAWDGCLTLSTFHTFPDECTVVKTQTLIERT